MDDRTPLDAIRPRLERYEWVAYTTHSQTDEKPKYRIVIPLAQPVPAKQWPEV